MADNQKDRKPEPTACVAVDEEPSFFGDVGVPLEKILAERDVAPEGGESEKEHPHDVVMFYGEEAFEVSCTD